MEGFAKNSYFIDNRNVANLICFQSAMKNRMQLHRQLKKSFNAEAVRDLCFYLDVDYDDVSGSERSGKLLSLLDHLQRSGRLPELLKICEEIRPDVNWSSLFGVEQDDVSGPIESDQMEVSNPAVPEWLEIPAGKFWMGSNNHDWEKPVHQVHLETYWISKTPVTNSLYYLFVQDSHHQRIPKHWRRGKIPIGIEDHPVSFINWDDAVTYCEWLSEITDKLITLPSEAEWEKAARGDEDQREYPWGNDFSYNRANTREAGARMTTPVNYYAEGASPYGVLDMCGNVWEWTRSMWSNAPMSGLFQPTFFYPYKADDGRENMTRLKTIWRVLRGGSFNSNKAIARCSYRHRLGPRDGPGTHGFRVVISPPP